MELDTVVKRMVLTLKCVLLFVNWQSFVFLLKILNIHCCFENKITKFDDVNGRSNRSPVQLHLFIYTLDFSSSVTLHKRPKLSALSHNKVKVPDIFIVCIQNNYTGCMCFVMRWQACGKVGKIVRKCTSSFRNHRLFFCLAIVSKLLCVHNAQI